MSGVRKIRRAQIVSPFGPGAIIDLAGESFVAEDAGRWRGRPEWVPFQRFAAYLKVSRLRTPADGEKLPYYRFPRWLFCPKCRQMTRWITESERDGTRPACEACPGRKPMVPMRFVAVCGNGHLADIEWQRWAHSEARRDRNQLQCQTTDLRFRSRKAVGGGLVSLEVACKRCGASRSLDGLTSRSALTRIGMTCRGRQPWQAPQDERSCDKPVVAMQRGASSVYFPVVISAIDIPPDSNWAVIEAAATKLLQHSDFLTLVERPSHPLRSELIAVIAADTELSTAEVQSELANQLGDAAAARPDGTIDDIKPEEWVALCHPQSESDHRDYFIARPAELPAANPGDDHAHSELRRLLTSVTLVERLREVRVLRGFERHTMDDEVPANLASRPDYYPAVEVFGEGYFLRFAEELVAEWESRPRVRAHCHDLAARARNSSLNWLPEVSPRLVMFHTLAHVLLRSTAFEAGYSTSSLHERLYVTPDPGSPAMAGVLIYTAAGDNQGTLGGLVRLGEYARLTRLLFSAISSARWCSFDPVCGESRGQGPGALSLAACHACSLVPETSCEIGNRLLDRSLLVGEEIGFFASLAAAIGDVPGGGTW